MMGTAVNLDPSQDMISAENIKEAARRKDKKPPKKITEKYLYNSGLAYLQRFPASVPHFKRVMLRKIDKSCAYHKEQDRALCLTLLDHTVATFEHQGLLDDNAYTQGMVNSLRRRGLSKKAIRFKLQQKGLSEIRIDEALKHYDGDAGLHGAELLAALILMRKKRLGCFGSGPVLDKHMGTFARAGFSYDIAQKALHMHIDEAEDYFNQRAI